MKTQMIQREDFDKPLDETGMFFGLGGPDDDDDANDLIFDDEDGFELDDFDGFELEDFDDDF